MIKFKLNFFILPIILCDIYCFFNFIYKKMDDKQIEEFMKDRLKKDKMLEDELDKLMDGDKDMKHLKKNKNDNSFDRKLYFKFLVNDLELDDENKEEKDDEILKLEQEMLDDENQLKNVTEKKNDSLTVNKFF